MLLKERVVKAEGLPHHRGEKDRDRHGALEKLRSEYEFSLLVGSSRSLTEVLEVIAQVADTQATVLIQGESGTGKELVAKTIHLNSSRREKSFVVVNAGAIPENLLESELFGYEKGAFTGATVTKPGKFELANGGTIFLDEIGDMSPFLQAKILRTIQTRENEHLGGTRVMPLDVRILAATNKSLLPLITQGKFREELYYRLNIVNIHIPALRERTQDIPVLAEFFLTKYAEREHKKIKTICLPALEVLETYGWPGNVRELENVIEHAVILCHETRICVPHLPKEIVGPIMPDIKEVENFYEAVHEFKRLLIVRTLQDTNNNKAEAARRLGLNRTYLFKLLEQLGIR
jgi:transcriptional regulator with PAS, ATPase and Fis domain